MFCESCGAELRDGTSFCTSCGQATKVANTTPQMATSFAWARKVERARMHLHPGETIRGWATGYVIPQQGLRRSVVVATEERILVVRQKLFGFALEEFPYSKMTSIEMTTGLLKDRAIITVASNRIVMDLFKNPNPQLLVNFVRSQIGTNVRSADRYAAGSTDIASQLERLSELRTKGVLTVEQFEQAKKKLLG